MDLTLSMPKFLYLYQELKIRRGADEPNTAPESINVSQVIFRHISGIPG
jgi:hypothetical protein